MMIVQIDFKAQSRSGNLSGRVKLRCNSYTEAEQWLENEMKKYNMRLLADGCSTIVPEEYPEDSYLQDVIEI